MWVNWIMLKKLYFLATFIMLSSVAHRHTDASHKQNYVINRERRYPYISGSSNTLKNTGNEVKLANREHEDVTLIEHDGNRQSTLLEYDDALVVPSQDNIARVDRLIAKIEQDNEELYQELLREKNAMKKVRHELHRRKNPVSPRA